MRLEVHSTTVYDGHSTSGYKGVSYQCGGCRAILSVGIDPLALKADLVKEVVKALRGR